ncbi:LacI family DNA-binding transcriptional regulator [Rothia halotolerans]|uniref:LacI family DNA-binding transcriptional regulator n=1 Tax=Rothia halotolerans TaxID=405770 RepID=UPI00192D81BE|nr:LacI family DNA-binding transcriptional regulator [Rothia halotolerans]
MHSGAGEHRGLNGMEKRNRRPSMAEVAQHAGVSHQTVSRVINGFAGVRPQTKERIEAAIAELGYRRNNAARTLVTRRSGLLGVIAAGSFLYGPTSTLAGIEEAARHRSYTTLLATIREGAQQEFENAIGVCLDRAVEAIVVIAAQEDVMRYLSSLSVDVPVIVVGPDPHELPSLATMSVDQNEGARLAVRHLLELGHRRIVLLSGPERWVDAAQRTKGAVEECAAAGVDPVVVHGDWTPASGYRLGREIAERAEPEGALAVFAANDAMALGLLSALHEARVEVPGRVSVVGFDDIPEAEFFTPSLTTVRQDFTELGHRVVEAVMAEVDGQEADLTPVPPTLSRRGSTASACG